MNGKQAIPGRPRGRIPLAREGWPFLIPCALLLIAAWLADWTYLAVILGALLLFMLNFFRDPERITPAGSGLFVSPADGKVVRAEAAPDGVFVDIFMNVFDVHVNRAPMAGRITHMQYTPGRFVNAAAGHAGEVNERNRIEMETDDGHRIAFTQIAGLVARRIVSFVAVGERVRAGQRIGMIRFGSRVNCELPADFALAVSVGDRVRAGETVLARVQEDGAREHGEKVS